MYPCHTERGLLCDARINDPQCVNYNCEHCRTYDKCPVDVTKFKHKLTDEDRVKIDINIKKIKERDKDGRERR